MKRLLGALIVLALLGLHVAGAWAGVPSRSGCVLCDPAAKGSPAAKGGQGTITVIHGVSDAVPGRAKVTRGRGSEQKRDRSWVNERTAPTCTGNGLWHDDVLCGLAVQTCPALDQVRFWVWHQTVRVDVEPGQPDVVTKGDWVQEPGTYCLGPDDPGAPGIVLALAAAQSAFEQRVRQLPEPRTRSVPGPRTLVRYPTAITASNAAPFSFDVTVAGATVHLDVRPLRYDWALGDGTTARTSTPRVSHSYSRTGRMTVRVTVTWGGSFTVNGGSESYPIDPPATSTGARDRITVLQARAENVVG